jgi:hypothetical protein
MESKRKEPKVPKTTLRGTNSSPNQHTTKAAARASLVRIFAVMDMLGRAEHWWWPV